MTNKDMILEYVEGKKPFNGTNRIGYQLEKLFNYDTELCSIDRKAKTAEVNVRKYGATTSKIQSILKAVLLEKGYHIVEYTGSACDYWDAGKPRYTKADFAI